jgi:hypothetical protein
VLRVTNVLWVPELRLVCGTWYGYQACSTGIWNNVIPDGVRCCVEGDKCVMGARTQTCVWNLVWVPSM